MKEFTTHKDILEELNKIGDKYLECIYIKTNAFDDTPIENCTLHVPAGTEDAYRAHPVFGKFKEVIIEK